MSEQTFPSHPKSVGVSHQRVEVAHKLTGDALFTGDLLLPGMLHAKVKTSPHARARILGIDTSRAEALRGVHAVLTGHEVDYRLGLYVVDKDILAKDSVRHFGEAVAAVAAETPDIASRAIELIDVEYEVLPAVLDPMEAIQEGAPLVHPDLGDYECVGWITPKAGTNICNHLKVRKGDYDKALVACAHVVENRFEVPQVQHVPLETHVSVARVDLAGRVQVHT